MPKSKKNDYTIEIAVIRKGESRFVTVTDVQHNRYSFNVIKSGGGWIIRNPSTVPAFILEMEQEILEAVALHGS
jgi:hypothetical protein